MNAFLYGSCSFSGSWNLVYKSVVNPGGHAIELARDLTMIKFLIFAFYACISNQMKRIKLLKKKTENMLIETSNSKKQGSPTQINNYLRANPAETKLGLT